MKAKIENVKFLQEREGKFGKEYNFLIEYDNKKAYYTSKSAEQKTFVIVKLKILEDSRRSRANGDKCRCNKALVLEFQDKDGTSSGEKEYTSNEYAKCTYKVGEIVYADSWDDNRWNECSHGIHFFVDRQSAVDY